MSIFDLQESLRGAAERLGEGDKKFRSDKNKTRLDPRITRRPPSFTAL